MNCRVHKESGHGFFICISSLREVYFYFLLKDGLRGRAHRGRQRRQVVLPPSCSQLSGIPQEAAEGQRSALGLVSGKDEHLEVQIAETGFSLCSSARR